MTKLSVTAWTFSIRAACYSRCFTERVQTSKTNRTNNEIMQQLRGNKCMKRNFAANTETVQKRKTADEELQTCRGRCHEFLLCMFELCVCIRVQCLFALTVLKPHRKIKTTHSDFHAEGEVTQSNSKNVFVQLLSSGNNQKFKM